MNEATAIQKSSDQHTNVETISSHTDNPHGTETDLEAVNIEATQPNDKSSAFSKVIISEQDGDHRGIPKTDPPWRSDETLFKSRFIRSSFWGSQVGIAGALYFIFSSELFIPIGIQSRPERQATIDSDYGFWFVMGCAIVSWLMVALLLLIGGATFSSAFKWKKPSASE